MPKRDEIDRKVDIMNAQWLVGGSLIGLIVAPIYINNTRVVEETVEGKKQLVTKPDGYNYTAIVFTVLFASAFIVSLYNANKAYRPVVA